MRYYPYGNTCWEERNMEKHNIENLHAESLFFLLC